MYKFTKTRDPSNPYDLTTVEIEVDAATLDDLMEAFHSFLMASGFPVNWSDAILLEGSSTPAAGVEADDEIDPF